MLEFIQNLLSQDFMPHGHCFFWRPEVLWLFVVSDGLIVVSYFSIPIAIIYFAYKRGDLMFKRIFLMFGLFIISCGLTHLMFIWTLWHPMYRLEGALRFFTGIISIYTAVMLWPIIPKALALPSPSQLRDTNRDLILQIHKRKRTEKELEKIQLKLEKKVKDRTLNLSKANQELEMEVNQHKKAEEELIKYRENLEELVIERTQELEKVQDELVRKEKFTVIGRVSGSIAHDIRYPLATIKNSSYFLNMTLKDSDEKTKKHLKLIDSEVNHANEIISSLIRLSETKVPEKSRINTNEYIKEFFSKFSLPEHVKLAVDLDSECPGIMIDSIQLRQVFVNIISNAIRVMPEEGTLTVKTRFIQGEELRVENKIGESSKIKGGFVEISFADTGSGIKRDNLDKIFEPFFSTRSKGMGLGLSIVKDIIVSNDGVITAESKEGKGCTFVMKFPVIKNL